MFKEKYQNDAPAYYGAEEASAWASGWNACMESLQAMANKSVNTDTADADAVPDNIKKCTPVQQLEIMLFTLEAIISDVSGKTAVRPQWVQGILSSMQSRVKNVYRTLAQQEKQQEEPAQKVEG